MKNDWDMLRDPEQKELNSSDEYRTDEFDEEDIDLNDILAHVLAHNYVQLREKIAEDNEQKFAFMGFVVIIILSVFFIKRAIDTIYECPLPVYSVFLVESVAFVAVLPLSIKKVVHDIKHTEFSQEDQSWIRISLSCVKGIYLGALPICFAATLFAPASVDNEVASLFCDTALMSGVILILCLIGFLQDRTIRKLVLTDVYLVFTLLAIPVMWLTFI